MSVLSFAADDLFVLRVFKAHVNNPDNVWANSYEFKAADIGSEGQLLALGVAVTQFEQGLHTAAVSFVRLTISTWEEDSVPYNPDAFISTTLTGVGARTVTGDLIGLNNAFAVARVAASGRFGHIFYRGVLAEADVAAPAGKTVLSNKSGMQTLIESLQASSGLNDYMGATPDGGLSLVMVNKDGTNVRLVVELVAQGVSALPLDHAWFNRTTT